MTQIEIYLFLIKIMEKCSKNYHFHQSKRKNIE